MNMNTIAILSVFLLIQQFASVCNGEEGGSSVIVDTQFGQVKGFRHKIDESHSADVFLSIPYATPPIGDLRFERPRSLENKWDGVLEATSFGPACYPHAAEALLPPQYSNFSEDCLTLNIMRPTRNHDAAHEKLATLVWIHGGGYEVGSSIHYGYKEFANIYTPHDIIVVSIQYRLGFLGFWTTADDENPGNMGLFDQAEAIKWIYENIETFGGDKSRIRLWGLSAGGASTSQLSLSPYSQNYINGTFEMSGVAWNNWAMGRDDELVAASTLLGKELGCSQDIKQCLKKKSVEEMYGAVTRSIGISGPDVVLLKFTPRIDGDFLPDHPDELTVSAKRKPVSVIGVGEKEDSFFVLHGLAKVLHNVAVPREEWPSFNRQKFIDMIEESDFGSSLEYAKTKIVEFYTRGESANSSDYLFYLNRYNLMFSDLHFAVGATKGILKKAAAGWPVYAYSFEHYNQKAFESLPKQLQGSTHTNEYPYMFNMYHLGEKFDIDVDPQEVAVRDLMRNSLISYAKEGVPKLRTAGDVQWPAVSRTQDAAQIEYFKFLPKPIIGKGYHNEAFNFWMNLKKSVPFDLIEFRQTNQYRDEL